MNEIWAEIDGFPLYEISNFGQVRTIRTGRIRRPQKTLEGDLIVRLRRGNGYATKSIRRMVAEAFVDRPEYTFAPFNTTVLLDGDKENVAADNIVWRPKWFSQKYAQQFRKYRNEDWFVDYPVLDLTTDTKYENVLEAVIASGILADEVWRSHYEGRKTFPNGHHYRINFVNRYNKT